MPEIDARTLLTAHALTGLLACNPDPPAFAILREDGRDHAANMAVLIADACMDRLGYCCHRNANGARCADWHTGGPQRLCAMHLDLAGEIDDRPEMTEPRYQ